MSAKKHVFTLGIEEEFAIIDPETRELRSHIQEILEGGKVTLKEQIKPEMHQSVVELGTEICQSVVDARAHVIFGLHVHVGIADREMAIHVMNQARYFLPHIYALSVNSPFWVGCNTGLKGYRLKVFERFPRTGIPDSFESLSEYEDYCKLLVTT